MRMLRSPAALSRRRLICEGLEDRCLLAAVFATVEIPPSRMDVIEQSTRTFIEEAIRNVVGVSDVRAIGSDIAVESDITEDGRSVSIANVVIDLDQQRLVSSGTATALSKNGSTLNLQSIEFTFIVYADRTVEIRASLSDRIAFSLPNVVLQRENSVQRDNVQAVADPPTITIGNPHEIPLLRSEHDVHGVSGTPVAPQISLSLRELQMLTDDMLRMRKLSTFGLLDGRFVDPIEDVLSISGVGSGANRSAADGMLTIRLSYESAEQEPEHPMTELSRSVDFEFSLQRYSRHECPGDKTGVIPVPADMIGLRINVASRTIQETPAALATCPTALFQIFITSADQPRCESIVQTSGVPIGFEGMGANDQSEVTQGREPFFAIGFGCAIWFALSHRSRPCTPLAWARSLPRG